MEMERKLEKSYNPSPTQSLTQGKFGGAPLANFN